VEVPVAASPVVYVNWMAVLVPPAVVTVIVTVPAGCAGSWNVSLVGLTTVTSVGGTGLLSTVTVVCPGTNPVPVTVTVSPPVTSPLAGVIAATVGVPDDAVGVAVAAELVIGAAVVVAVLVGIEAQTGVVKVFVSSVTDPLRASARPRTVVPVLAVMEVRARIEPRKVELVPSVADAPICQNTLQACAPLIKLTELADAVVSDEPTWKMKTEFGLPCPFKVNVPVNPAVLAAV